MVSGTITDASGRTLSGQTVEAFLIPSVPLGADQLKPLKELAHNTHLIFLHILMQDYLMPLRIRRNTRANAGVY
jgi:hypothetical protein